MAQVFPNTAAPAVWRVRPQHAASAVSAGKLLAGVALLGGLIAGGFAAVGAWMVLPFTGLEIIALGWALRHVARSSEDFEEVRLAPDSLRVSARVGGHDIHATFHPYWARVLFTPSAQPPRLVIRSHGREVEIGRLLDPAAKSILARELAARLESLRTPVGAGPSHPLLAENEEDS